MFRFVLGSISRILAYRKGKRHFEVHIFILKALKCSPIDRKCTKIGKPFTDIAMVCSDRK